MPTARPAPSISARASSRLLPITLGTAMLPVLPPVPPKANTAMAAMAITATTAATMPMTFLLGPFWAVLEER